MQLIINNQNHTLIPMQKFRAQWALPDSFRMAYFESKEWEGLASLEGAGPALVTVRQGVLQAIPAPLALAKLLSSVDHLSQIFRRELEAANVKIGLRPVEVEFAVSGFYDVLQAVAYRLVELYHLHQHELAEVRDRFDFRAIYQSWLNDSIQVSATHHRYTHGQTEFKVRIIYNVYGHLGLEVTVLDEVYYVVDMSLACPAASYMYDLCNQVARALCLALTA